MIIIVIVIFSHTRSQEKVISHEPHFNSFLLQLTPQFTFKYLNFETHTIPFHGRHL
jgi:hypothetical protein